jgi:hypothetical protein
VLLPDKHISFAESLLGLGAFVMENVSQPTTVDNLWRTFQRQAVNYPAFQTFDNLVLALDALFALGLIEMNDVGELRRNRKEAALCA